MVHLPVGTLDTVPLMMVKLTPNADFVLDGYAQATFLLPKEQVAERGFALQLFRANIGKTKTTYDPIWTFDKSSLTGSALTFGFLPPKKTTIPKNATYVLVLYGDDKSKVTSPAPAATPTAAATSTAAPTPEESPE